MPLPEECWAAFAARDRRYDGRFVVGVLTTGIYCKPSCPARRPLPQNAVLHATPADARAAGLRPCLRCKPEECARDHTAVAEAVALIAASTRPMALAELAGAVGYAPHHFGRVFKRATGVTPASYARALRADAASRALDGGAGVAEAVYAAGYSGPSRFYSTVADRLGMTPSAWRRGGAGVTIRWTVAATSLGPLLIAATTKGLCRVAFDEDGAALAARFPNADLAEGGDALDRLAAHVVGEVDAPGRGSRLPIDVRGTAFQEAVWAALRRIPAGETRSYAQIAVDAGAPRATRAVGSACGANPVAIVVPCHRVTRAGGEPGGYAYGADRKRALLDRERAG